MPYDMLCQSCIGCLVVRRSLVPMSLAYVIRSPSDRRSALLLHQQTCVGQVTQFREQLKVME
jgi:hypothetical protein